MRDAWRLAVGTLTAVPVRSPTAVDRRTAGTAMVLAPLAVLPLAVVVTGVGLVGAWAGLPGLLVAVLAVAGVVLGNRALHLDGLSDTVDGLAASFDRERSLAVMRTGTSGPAGVAALVLVLAVQVVALAPVLDSVRGAVLAGVSVCVSRAALSLCCVRGLPAARTDGLGNVYTQTVPRLVVAAAWVLGSAALVAVAAWAGSPWWSGLVAAGLALVVLAALLRHVLHRLGGVTGDVFGAAVELAWAALLVGLAVSP